MSEKFYNQLRNKQINRRKSLLQRKAGSFVQILPISNAELAVSLSTDKESREIFETSVAAGAETEAE